MRRAVLSCDCCRSRKVRCDRNLPCHNCVQKGTECIWSEAQATQSPVVPVPQSHTSVSDLYRQIQSLQEVIGILGNALGFSREQIAQLHSVHRARDMLNLSPLPQHEQDDAEDSEDDLEMIEEDRMTDGRSPVAQPSLVSVPPVSRAEGHEPTPSATSSSTPDAETQGPWTPDANIEHVINFMDYPALGSKKRTISTMTSVPVTPSHEVDASPFFSSQPPLQLERHWA